jgi:L-threonylcarbamoyladenylate synthase
VLNGGDADAVAAAVAALEAGQVIGLPTDTVYGLAAALDRPQALDRLFRMKGRPVENPIPVLLSGMDRLERVATEIPAAAFRLAGRCWPGGLTLVVPAAASLPDQVTAKTPSGTRTVAVRVPDHRLALTIIAAIGGALAVTSANRSGDAPCRRADEVAALGESAPALVIDGGPAEVGVASTIVSVVEDPPVVVREGAIPARDIARALAGAPSVRICGGTV